MRLRASAGGKRGGVRSFTRWRSWLYAEGVRGLTPKALANFSPGLERSDNLGTVASKGINAESVAQV